MNVTYGKPCSSAGGSGHNGVGDGSSPGTIDSPVTSSGGDGANISGCAGCILAKEEIKCLKK